VQQNTIEPLHDNWNAVKKKLSLTLVTRSFYYYSSSYYYDY